MATHGFIEFKQKDEKQEDRTLVHAVHDGYLTDMLLDIITLPFYIVNRFKEKTVYNEVIPEFLHASNRNRTHFTYKNFSDGFESYDHALFSWEDVIPLDETRWSSISYLIAKRPDKYQVEKEPFILYGYPLDKTNISINFTDKRLNTATITINEKFDNDSNEREQILNLINDINNFIVNDDAKIIVLNNGKKIVMNFDKIVLDLIFYKKF